MLHGFTGNPSSMRGVAEALAATGLAVELPLLPGHGTTVEDMLTTRFPDWAAAAEAAYLELAGRVASLVVVGLSMGATLAAWVTARNPGTAGLVAINGMFEPPAPAFLDLLRTSLDQGCDRLPAIGSDIALPGVSEGAYDAAPIEPLISLMEATTRAPRPPGRDPLPGARPHLAAGPRGAAELVGRAGRGGGRARRAGRAGALVPRRHPRLRPGPRREAHGRSSPCGSPPAIRRLDPG